MKRFAAIAEVIVLVGAIILVNASTLTEGLLYGHWDHSLIESTRDGGEDEMRYLAKTREAAEGRWLMLSLIHI